MNMNMEGLIRLSVSKKRPKKLISRHKGCQLLVIEPVHSGSNCTLKVLFLGHPLVNDFNHKNIMIVQLRGENTQRENKDRLGDKIIRM